MQQRVWSGRRRNAVRVVGFVRALRVGAVALLGATLLAACTGSGEGLDANGQPLSSSAPAPLSADFQSIQDNVFTPLCTRCHEGANAPAGLQLDAGHSYGLLVGVPSVEVPSLLRVKAGDPDNSYLVMKLEGSGGISGARMPLGGPYLDAATLGFIRQWISNGAAPPAAAPAAVAAVSHAASRPEVFALTGTQPAQGATAAVTTLVLSFSSEPDLASLAAALALVRAADVPQVIPFSVARAAGNPSTALLWLSQPLAPGRYQLGPAAQAMPVLSVTGQPLAGAFSLTFTVEETP